MSPVQSPLHGHPIYEKVADLSSSSKAFTQVARNKETGELVAIKFTPRGWDKTQSKYMLRELVNLQELSLSHHPHIVEFKDVFLTRHYLAQAGEYVEGSTLQGFLEKAGGRVIEAVARFLFQQLVLAVDFIHRKSKINRDIKLSNVLLSMPEGQLPLLKLCDFGFSKDTYRDSQACSQVGTALYVAPEVMQNFEEGPYDGRACDIWACGVVLAIMLYGRHPFLRLEDEEMIQSQQMIKLFQRVMDDDAEYPMEIRKTLSDSCMDLVLKMLKVDPKDRIKMEDILQHPWFLEAIPPGATTMNTMFVADTSSILSAEALVEIEALVLQGSMTEKHGGTARTSSLQENVQQRLAQRKRLQQQQQQRIDEEIEQHQILEEMVMNMPSSELLHAATVDLRPATSNPSPLTYNYSAPATFASHSGKTVSPTQTNASSSGGGAGSPPNTTVTQPMRSMPPVAQNLGHQRTHSITLPPLHQQQHHHLQQRQQQQQLHPQHQHPTPSTSQYHEHQPEELDLQQLHIELQEFHQQQQQAQAQESCLSDTSRHDVYPSPYRFILHEEETEHSTLEDISSLGVNSESWANFSMVAPHQDNLGVKRVATAAGISHDPQQEDKRVLHADTAAELQNKLAYGSAAMGEKNQVLIPRSRARRRVATGTFKGT